MEKVGVLITRLLEQYHNKASNEQLKMTAQLLLSELEKQEHEVQNGHSVVSVFYPAGMQVNARSRNEETMPEPEPKQEPVVEVQQAQPSKPEPAKQQYPFYDLVTETPTLALKQQELNETIASRQESLNDKLKSVSSKKEVAHNIAEGPIKDLRKAIGINDQYLFINELFRGDQTMYERSIKTINGFNIYAEAELWIKRELKLKLAWNEKSEVTKLFDQLVSRRFA